MTIDLSELQQKKLAELQASASEGVVTAFLISQTEDGQWVADVDFKNKDLSMTRTATFDDLVAGCAAVQSGAQIQQTAMTVMHLMSQRAQMMSQQMQAQQQQQEAQTLASRLDPNLLRSKNA